MMPAKIKKLLFGNNQKNGILKMLAYYFVLFGIGFVFLYPILYMLVNSMLSQEDLNNPAVYWIPSGLYFGNYAKAFVTLDFLKSFRNSVLMSLVPAVLQTIVAALTGYALARFRLPGQRMWMVCIVVIFLIPSQITSIPRYILFNNYHMLNTVFPSYLSAILGQGLRSTIFILIFQQFFSSYPKSFDEAAELDGAGRTTIFVKIALPMSVSAIVMCLLFSFVWYWNETTQANLLFGTAIKTLPLQLANFTARYEAIFGSGDAAGTANRLNESITFAGTVLSILPTVLLYLLVQKQFVESIERSGITGE